MVVKKKTKKVAPKKATKKATAKKPTKKAAAKKPAKKVAAKAAQPVKANAPPSQEPKGTSVSIDENGVVTITANVVTGLTAVSE